MQLMAEDVNTSTQEQDYPTAFPILDKDDIKTRIYEGGLKTWECSLDLVRLLLEDETYLSFQNDVKVMHLLEVIWTSS